MTLNVHIEVAELQLLVLEGRHWAGAALAVFTVTNDAVPAGSDVDEHPCCGVNVFLD